MAPANNKDRPVDGGPDRDAILSRRTFLIEAALVPSGLGLVAGCKDKSRPQLCLNVRSNEPDGGAQVETADDTSREYDFDGPEPCLMLKPKAQLPRVRRPQPLPPGVSKRPGPPSD